MAMYKGYNIVSSPEGFIVYGPDGTRLGEFPTDDEAHEFVDVETE